jgi:hypothetical protein
MTMRRSINHWGLAGALCVVCFGSAIAADRDPDASESLAVQERLCAIASSIDRRRGSGFRNLWAGWHGDYHFDYNTQQLFWAVFSSNQLDLHLPYVRLVESVLPVSQRWAADYYRMRGAYFPLSTFPVEMPTYPYPPPVWNWMICQNSWVVQSLWWHYRYSMDATFLRNRGFRPIKEVVSFLVDYIRRPDVADRGWGDNLYHIFPSISPELYDGLNPGFEKNYDTLADLAMTRFIFGAYVDACGVLDYEQQEADLLGEVADILQKMPEYPTANSRRGEVFVSVEGEHPDTIYNVPVTLMSVFPAEQHGLSSSKGEYELAVNTYMNQQNEGGNELVFLNMQAARFCKSLRMSDGCSAETPSTGAAPVQTPE